MQISDLRKGYYAGMLDYVECMLHKKGKISRFHCAGHGFLRKGRFGRVVYFYVYIYIYMHMCVYIRL